MIRRISPIVLFIGISFGCLSQNLDSLRKLLKKTNLHDTVRLNTIMATLQTGGMGEIENSLEPLGTLAEKMIRANIPANIKCAKKGMAMYLDTKALLLREQGDYQGALRYVDSAIVILRSIKRNDLLPHMFHSKGLLLTEKGQYVQAIDVYQEGLNISEKNKDTSSIMHFTGAFAVNYMYLQQTKEALRFAFRSLELARLMKDDENIVDNLNTLGSIYSDRNQFDSAVYFSREGYKLAKKNNDEYMMPTLINNLGFYLQELSRYEEALLYYQEAIKLSSRLGNDRQLVTHHNNISYVYYKMGKLQLAKKEGELAFELTGKETSPSVLRNVTRNLSRIYRDLKDFPKANKMLELYVAYKDTIANTEMRNEATKKQMNYLFEKEQLADSLKVEEDKRITTIQLEQEKNQRYVLYAGLALVLVFAIFMFNRFKVTQRQKRIIEVQKEEVEKQKHVVEEQKSLIEEKHKEITDSINYAERIQRSFLATKEILDANLPEYFVLFRPKDIVSGDFYWASNLSGSRFAIATADSTGHGVPGAIMSLLNITSIEAAIKDGKTQAADILNATRKTIIDRLKKDGSAEGGKDGMDCSLCIYDISTKKLQIAAANNPVWIARPTEGGSYELIDIKPDKMPVGKHDKQNTPFSQHEIELKKDDVIYTLTDGFSDQFGGPLGKKFMSKNLRELLFKNAHKPMNEQKELLMATFVSWVNDLEQIDDVTIIGVRV